MQRPVGSLISAAVTDAVGVKNSYQAPVSVLVLRQGGEYMALSRRSVGSLNKKTQMYEGVRWGPALSTAKETLLARALSLAPSEAANLWLRKI